MIRRSFKMAKPENRTCPAQSQCFGNSAEPSPDPDANGTVKAQAHGGPCFFFGIGEKAIIGRADLNEKLRGGTQEGSR